MNLVILGAPGSGKGTQAEKIADKLHINIISTGDILRNAVRSGSSLGKKVYEFMRSGDLVPDNIIIEVMEERLKNQDCQNGFILDGFPRTIPQAMSLDKSNIELDKALYLKVQDEEIIKRLSGRRICNKCGATYHIEFNPPLSDDICDKCHNPLTRREDDDPVVIKDRLKVYHKETEPLVDYYYKEGKLLVVEGQNEVQKTTNLVFEKLGLS
jgi:adenylate kinase